ncbi:rhamnogalacturonan lyase [Saccharopolyspora sp. 6M]|uniref:rhamnogalacturonan lyase n=1 Tax=Saccharopolyspora sp. 6M TaxID=2877237 RepID=UPI001CD5E804|nr:rhamnogalacturonan lyase [Saccharopolyspora sp. 6M]MCA1226411.1 rhamnogalacturonan lyase [Saccharopolyspora sp. 6M]
MNSSRTRSPRRALVTALAAVVLPIGSAAPATGSPAEPARAGTASAETRAAEPGRAAISVRSGDDNFVSWRLFGTDPAGTTFDVYRDGTRITPEPLTGTGLLDRGAPADARYEIAPNGQRAAASTARAFAADHLDIPLDVPDGGTTPSGEDYTYSANDVGVGDLDGDGEYEYVVKWDPSNAKDNSQAGYTGPPLLDAYRLDGTRLWRIDLGRNIRAGAHYTQFQVYDYDGDGAAEVAVKTADGTVDGTGSALGDADADHRNGDGYVLDGPEFLTVFDGTTGAERHTADYVPGRGDPADWGDSYGNRCDRFLAATAEIDGLPVLIEARGYYTRSVITAWTFDGELTPLWTFDSDEAGEEYAGQGNHNLSIADVDDDGNDEVVYGAMAIDDDGNPLWNTGFGHGGALHVGDFDPDRPGLEVYKVDENSDQSASWLADAATGEVLWQTDPAGDNGRGVAGDIWDGNPGAEFWSAADDRLRDAAGEDVGPRPGSMNFLVWWDGDTSRELLDDTHIDKYTGDGTQRVQDFDGVASNNGTKATPALSADLMGDWREEVVFRTEDSSALRIFSTTEPTELSLPGLMEDRQYRLAVAWQNTAYNQPPHPSYSLADAAARRTGDPLP